MPRTFVIPDIHGRYDLLEKALKMIETMVEDTETHVIFLGDLIDRGPQSKEVVERIMKGPDRSTITWIVLRGNHEQDLIDAYDGNPYAIHDFFNNGGAETLDSYSEVGTDLTSIPVEHIDWMKSLPLYHEDDHRIYVHAGVSYDTNPADLTDNVLLNMRYTKSNDFPHISGKVIVHGHDGRNNGALVLKSHRLNLGALAFETNLLYIAEFDDTQIHNSLTLHSVSV